MFDPEIERLRELVRPENQPYSAGREEKYKAAFPYLSMSPEEYAARHSHTILAFSLHRYEYRDERLKTWLQALHELLSNRQRLTALRRQYLTSEELAEVEAAERSPTE